MHNHRVEDQRGLKRPRVFDDLVDARRMVKSLDPCKSVGAAVQAADVTSWGLVEVGDVIGTVLPRRARYS